MDSQAGRNRDDGTGERSRTGRAADSACDSTSGPGGGAAGVRLGTESESGHGWSWGATLAWPNGETTRHIVLLSWADHDDLSAGSCAPSATAAAALRALLATPGLDPGSAPERLDVSTIRRIAAGGADAIRGHLV